MQIKFQKLIHQHLFYSKPIRVIDELLYEREIATFTILIDENKYYAELSPLVGFHQNELNSTVEIYNQQLDGKDFELDVSAINLTSPLFNLCNLPQKVLQNISLLYAVEQSLFQFLLEDKDTLKQFSPTKEIASAELLTDTNSRPTAHTIKIKIRPNETDIFLSDKKNYRLDGNRSFSVKQINTFFDSQNIKSIEFIEDPLTNRDDYIIFNSPVPLALDENLVWGLEQHIPFDYAIIKPSIFAISRTLEIMDECHQKQVTPIISSSYEGSDVHKLLKIISTYKNRSALPQGLSPQSFIHPLSNYQTQWSNLFFSTSMINGNLYWEQLFKRSHAIATTLHTRLKTKQTIALCFPTTIQSIEYIFALWILEKTIVILPHKISELELEQVKTEIPIDEVITNPMDEPSLSFNKNIKLDHLFNLKNDSTSLILLTSGSTGTPKGICYSMNGLVMSAFSTISCYEMTTNTSLYQSLPLHHIGGFMIFFRSFILNSNYYIGQDINVLESKNIPLDYISLVPTQLEKYLKNDQIIKLLQRLKGVIIGGSSISPTITHSLTKFNIPFFLTYGMSETIAQITSNICSRTQGVGQTLKYYKIKIIDSTMHVKSQFLARGTMQKKQFMPLQLTDGYFSTQDLGFYKNDILHITGRKDRVFISGGENISPEEIEKVALTHQQITQAVLVNVDDDHFGCVGFLFYDTLSNQSIDDIQLKTFFKNNLSNFKCPKFFYYQPLTTNNLKISLPAYNDLAKTLISSKQVRHV